jgi:flagellar basal body-associated protein FliL
VSRTWWIVLIAVGVGVALAVLVGLFAYHANSENRAANDAYANSVCTAIGSWEQQMKTIGASGGTTQADLQSKSSQVETATQNLVDQIKAIPVPGTSDGQAAKQQLSQLSTDLTNSVQATKNGIATIKADTSAATISTVAVTLRTQYKALVDSAKSAADSLGGNALPLAFSFRRTDACKNL